MMASQFDLICPPIGGKYRYEDVELVRSLRGMLASEQRLREKYEAESIALRRLVLALLDEVQTGKRGDSVSLLIFDKTVVELDDTRVIRTEHDSRDGVTRIWAESK